MKLNLSLIIFHGNPGGRGRGRGRGVFCLGNPDRRGGLVLQEIQGVKKRPHLSEGGGGGGFFLEEPIKQYMTAKTFSHYK